MGFAVTDHNTCDAWPSLKKYAKGYGVEFVQGEEIRTYHQGKYIGELIGYFMNEPVEPGPYGAVLDELLDQGALISIAHPFDILRSPLFKKPLLSDKTVWKEVNKKVHALEGFNARATLKSFNKKAVYHAHSYKKAITGGSDAHIPEELGRGYTLCDGNSAEDLRTAILEKRTMAGGHRSNPFVHLFSTIAKHSDALEDPDVDHETE